MASQNAADLGETFDLLAHPYRRYVLYYLRTHSGEIAIDALTAALIRERESQSAMTGGDTSERIEIALRHTHLPKLADSGLIAFVRDERSIELIGTQEYDQFLDQASRIDGYAPPAAGD